MPLNQIHGVHIHNYLFDVLERIYLKIVLLDYALDSGECSEISRVCCFLYWGVCLNKPKRVNKDATNNQNLFTGLWSNLLLFSCIVFSVELRQLFVLVVVIFCFLPRQFRCSSCVLDIFYRIAFYVMIPGILYWYIFNFEDIILVLWSAVFFF